MDIATKEYLFGSIFLLSNKLQMLGDQYLQEITLKQWFLLMMIHTLGNKNPSVTEVAGYIGSTRQNVRKMLKVLEPKGYVKLTQNTDDKLNLSITLTEQTRTFFERFNDKGTAFMNTLFSDISDESLESCRKVFDALFQNIEKMELENE